MAKKTATTTMLENKLEELIKRLDQLEKRNKELEEENKQLKEKLNNSSKISDEILKTAVSKTETALKTKITRYIHQDNNIVVFLTEENKASIASLNLGQKSLYSKKFFTLEELKLALQLFE